MSSIKNLNTKPQAAAPMQRRTMVTLTLVDHASTCAPVWSYRVSFLEEIKEGGPRFT